MTKSICAGNLLADPDSLDLWGGPSCSVTWLKPCMGRGKRWLSFPTAVLLWSTSLNAESCNLSPILKERSFQRDWRAVFAIYKIHAWSQGKPISGLQIVILELCLADQLPRAAHSLCLNVSDSNRAQLDKEGVKLLSVKITSPETGECFFCVSVCVPQGLERSSSGVSFAIAKPSSVPLKPNSLKTIPPQCKNETKQAGSLPSCSAAALCVVSVFGSENTAIIGKIILLTLLW